MVCKKLISTLPTRLLGTLVLICAGLFVTTAAVAQTTVSLDQVTCLPIEQNGIVTLNAQNEPPGGSVRVYFRRLHEEVEDFYYVEAYPQGGGSYWSVLPKAEDQILEARGLLEDIEYQAGSGEDTSWAEWWTVKEASTDRDPNHNLNEDIIRERASVGKQMKRDWMADMTREDLQTWLEGLENEPTEYYSEVLDASGKVVARSPMLVTEVTQACPVTLTPKQESVAANLTVGETAYWKRGENVFHWMCSGIVTRINPEGLLRSDEVCRACVIAWWKKKEILLPLAAAVTAGGGILIAQDDNEPILPPVSPSGP